MAGHVTTGHDITRQGQAHMKNKAIAELSVDTQVLAKRLLQVEVGSVIAYTELSGLIGRDVQGKARYVLASARRMAERDEHAVFDVVHNEGLKRMDDSGVLASGKRAVVHIRRTATKSAKRLGTCLSYEKLSQDEKQEFNVTMAVNGAMLHFTKPSTVRALLPKVEHQMPVAKALEALKGTL
jgi:hypothetical protein